MLKKALILTVGTGSRRDVNIVEPLVKTIRDSAPAFTGFVVSEGSRKVAEEIVSTLGLGPDDHDVLPLSSEENLEQVYLEVTEWIRQVLARGFSPEEVTIDFTSGTKAMTSGAVLAGVRWSCAGLKYIAGTRKDGIVQSGTERFLTVQPNAVLAHREMEIGRRMIAALRFDAALEVFSSVHDAFSRSMSSGSWPGCRGPRKATCAGTSSSTTGREAT